MPKEYIHLGAIPLGVRTHRCHLRHENKTDHLERDYRDRREKGSGPGTPTFRKQEEKQEPAEETEKEPPKRPGGKPQQNCFRKGRSGPRVLLKRSNYFSIK